MRKAIILCLTTILISPCFSQSISSMDKIELQKKEDSLKIFSNTILMGKTAEERFSADSFFTKILVRALKTKNSFYYPFDSLKTISKLTPTDQSFKIFTWQLIINNNMVRKHGAIQMRTADGSLKLFPLIDHSPTIQNLRDTISNNFGWVGAVYYQIIEKKSFNNNFYTLLGYDENNTTSTKKIIEILTFKNGEPTFGGNFFSFPTGNLHKRSAARYIMEYKKNAGPRLTYDADQNRIVIEHLISETGEPNKESTFVGDGDYDALQWEDGKWVFIHKIYTQITPLGKEPVPMPLDLKKD
jgi:hypothetical protein